MYAGHYAAGLALKAKVPEAPTWGLLLGIGVLDILFGPLVLMGVERVTLTPDRSPGFSLDFTDWSHSLLSAVVLSIVFGLLFHRLGRRVMLVMGTAVFSHFVLDLVMHPPDLALWPGSDAHLGLGLWRALPLGWWFVELGFVVALCGYYGWRAGADPSFGGRPLAVVVTVLVLHVINSPWLSLW